MNESKTDRRIKYTKMMLTDALVKLMQKQHISTISVKSLCENADINRSTFYAHFKDQYDLLNHIKQVVLTKLKRHLEKQVFIDNLPISAQALTRILEYAKDNADLFTALLSENCDFAFQKDIMQLAQIVSSQQSWSFDQRTQEYIEIFGITGCITLFQKWLQDGMVESPTEISELILQLLYNGIVSFQNR